MSKIVLALSICFIQFFSVLNLSAECSDDIFIINEKQESRVFQYKISLSINNDYYINNSTTDSKSKNEHMLFCEHCMRCSHINLQQSKANISFNSNPIDATVDNYLFIYNPPHLQSAVKPPIPV